MHHADARALPVESGSADLVLTSPPYINVHNYNQKYRRSVEALEWDILAVARSEIGSNRQNRGTVSSRSFSIPWTWRWPFGRWRGWRDAGPG